MLREPIAPLLDWQREYIEDDERFKFVVACTQSGKSHATTLEYSLDGAQGKVPLSIMLSAGERQSIELMQKIKTHSRAMGAAFESGWFEQTMIAEHRATFPNGCRIIALPANPDTARGYSGNVFLDEFAMHRDSHAIWAAMMGRVTRGYKVRVASTFKGVDNKFYALAKSLGLHTGLRPGKQPVRVDGNEWSGHWVDVHMAVAQGAPINIEQQRRAIDDEEIWLQEYCNVPMSGAESFIPLELVMGCESGDASVEWDGVGYPRMYAGYDVGRKKDLAVIWIVVRHRDDWNRGEAMGAGEELVTRGVITMERMPFADQLKIAREVAAATERFCVDSTGIGAMIAEELHREYPHTEQVQFTAPVKERMAVELKKRFEERTIQIPESARIRRACSAVKRFVGPTGVMRFDAARTDQGHADEFWALALAVSAATGASGYVPASAGALVGKPVMSGMKEMQF